MKTKKFSKNIIKNKVFKMFVDLISILFNDIKYFTNSRFPDSHAKCNNVS